MFSTATDLGTGRRSAPPKNRAWASIVLAAAILTGGTSAALAQTGTEQKPQWESLIASGTSMPTGAASALSIGPSATDRSFDYRVLATSKTSTMEKELNEAAAAGYRFSKVMGGKVTNGGQVVVVTVKEPVVAGREVRKYRLLATSKTSTMQTEMQQLADRGYSYLDHTVFQSATGGKEVAVIMELDSMKSEGSRSSYRLLATTRSSSMEKELNAAGTQGYELLGFTVGKTGAGGSEIIAILRRYQ